MIVLLFFLPYRLLDICHGQRHQREMSLYLVFEHVHQDLATYLENCPSPGLGQDRIKVRIVFKSLVSCKHLDVDCIIGWHQKLAWEKSLLFYNGSRGSLPLNPKHKYKVHITLLRIFPLGWVCYIWIWPAKKTKKRYMWRLIPFKTATFMTVLKSHTRQIYSASRSSKGIWTTSQLIRIPYLTALKHVKNLFLPLLGVFYIMFTLYHLITTAGRGG